LLFPKLIKAVPTKKTAPTPNPDTHLPDIFILQEKPFVPTTKKPIFEPNLHLEVIMGSPIGSISKIFSNHLILSGETSQSSIIVNKNHLTFFVLKIIQTNI